MNEYIKENKKTLLIVGSIVVCLIVIGIELISIAKGRLAVASCPNSMITEAPRVLSDSYREQEKLNMCVRCAGTDYTVWLPSDADVTGDVVKAKMGDMYIIVTVSDMGLDYVINNIIPQEIYFSVLGYEPETNIIVTQTGYLYQYPANYVVSVSSAKISVRTATCYCMTYSIMVSGDRAIYIAVACEEKAEMEQAQELLDDIASSIRRYEALDAEIQELMMPEGILELDIKDRDEIFSANAETRDEGELLDISFSRPFEKEVEDGILVLMWENYMVSPTELFLFGPDGYQLEFWEEESTSGFYVYRVGKSSAGTYTAKGVTKTALKDIYVELYEFKEYDSLFGD